MPDSSSKFMNGYRKGDKMDQTEKYDILFELMAQEIKNLRVDLEAMTNSRQYWINEWNNLRYETVQLKPKRGRPAKKRGPGRPKKVKK